MKIGTMVMMNTPSNVYVDCIDWPPNGAIGEVVDTTAAAKAEMTIGNVAVYFPRNPSNSHTKLWSVPPKDLIPLSDPDAVVGDVDVNYLENKSDLVLESN